MNLKRTTGTPYDGAFHRMRTSPDGLLLTQYFKECLADVDKRNRRLKDNDVFVGQGYALALEAFLEKLEADVKAAKGTTNA